MFRPGGKLPIRQDILLYSGGVRKVLDIVISHPSAHSEPRVADTPGIAAYNAALKKENLYYNNFVIPAVHMVPLSAKTGGRFDSSFSNFLKEVVTSGLDFGESPVPVWTKETRALFTSRLRSVHVTTSYAIARYRAALQMLSFMGRQLSHGIPCARLSAYLISEALMHA